MNLIKKQKKKKPISVASRKDKARNLQKWVCRAISEYTGIEWGRGDEYLIESRQMGQAGTDVVLKNEAAERFPFAVECKSGESIGWQSSVRQARKNTPKGKDWIVFLKTKEFKDPVVMLGAKVFFKIIK